MRSQYMMLFFLLVGLQANAQSDQYKRGRKTTTPNVANPQAPSAKKSNSKDSLKVDIEDLEQQYWTPQDTEFKVVQNRKYSKEDKLALSVQLVPILSDPYSEDGGTISATLGYYFNEFHGVELNYTMFNVDKSEVVDRFSNQFGGTAPDYAIMDNYIGVNYNWIPIYGKMSVQDKRIIYFDLAVSPGIGLLEYEPIFADTVPAADRVGPQKTVVLSLDISQHFFFSERWAFRLDMKTRKYKEERYTNAGPNAGDKVGDVSRTVTLWQFGLTYYFDLPQFLKKKKSVEGDPK